MLWFLGYLVVAFVVAVGLRRWEMSFTPNRPPLWFAIFGLAFLWPATLGIAALEGFPSFVNWCARRLGGKG